MRLRWLDALLTTFAMRSSRRGDPVELTTSAVIGAGRSYENRILLRPVNPAFIWSTLFIALAANLVPWGRSPLVPDFLALARGVRARKFGPGVPQDRKERARQARFLQYRGFSTDHIRAVLEGDPEEDSGTDPGSNPDQP